MCRLSSEVSHVPASETVPVAPRFILPIRRAMDDDWAPSPRCMRADSHCLCP